MKLLPPQRLRPHYYEGVEQALRDAFRAFLFEPLTAILAEGTTQADAVFANTAPAPNRDLQRALRTGAVQYRGGFFSGEVDARVGAYLKGLGAEFDARLGRYHLPEFLAPGWLRAEAAAADRRAQMIHDKLARELDRAKERLEAGGLPIPLDPAGPIEAIEEGFETAAESLGISKRIPPAQRAAMEARYAADVRHYVVEATAEYIDELHKAVIDNAAAGYRYEHLVGEITHMVDVSERKARFLARQETSLFMSAYRRERFEAAGVTRYKWSTSHDVRVRPYADEQKKKKYGDHRALDGQFFTYDAKAPAAFMSSKKPCNPGEDFGCRCVDLAVLE